MDAHASAEWIAVGEEFPGLVSCVTRGWLVEDTPKSVTLAGTLSLSPRGTVSGYGEVLVIPKRGFVVKVKKVKV